MESIFEWIQQPWPWYVSGAMISLVMFLLLWEGGEFGVSSTLRTACSIGGFGKMCDFFDFNWRTQLWNLVFVVGAIVGGYIASHWLTLETAMVVSEHTMQSLKELGISSPEPSQYLPTSLFSMENAGVKNWLLWIIGGILVGFGARYAGGCTSGHAISGLSNFQVPSLIAVIGFFLGGLFMTHILFPIIF